MAGNGARFPPWGNPPSRRKEDRHFGAMLDIKITDVGKQRGKGINPTGGHRGLL